MISPRGFGPISSTFHPVPFASLSCLCDFVSRRYYFWNNCVSWCFNSWSWSCPNLVSHAFFGNLRLTVASFLFTIEIKMEMCVYDWNIYLGRSDLVSKNPCFRGVVDPMRKIPLKLIFFVPRFDSFPLFVNIFVRVIESLLSCQISAPCFGPFFIWLSSFFVIFRESVILESPVGNFMLNPVNC